MSATTRRIELPRGRSGPTAVGDAVRISASAADVLRGSLWIYGLPWLTLLLGTLLGAVVDGGDAAASIGASAGLAAGALLLKLLPRFVTGPRLEVRADE